jgi:hypothetical protein
MGQYQTALLRNVKGYGMYPTIIIAEGSPPRRVSAMLRRGQKYKDGGCSLFGIVSDYSHKVLGKIAVNSCRHISSMGIVGNRPETEVRRVEGRGGGIF